MDDGKNINVNNSNPATTTTTSPTNCTTTSAAAALAARRQVYGPNAALSYEQPLLIVRGAGAYLYDEQGVPYLDCVNNVAHLGHAHEEVAAAVCSQLHTLNTNSRYLHPALPDYTRTLLRTLNCDPGRGGDCGGSSGGCCTQTNGEHDASGAASPCSSSSPCCRHHANHSSSSSSAGACCGGGNASSSAITTTTTTACQRLLQQQFSSPAAPPPPAPLEVLYLVCSGSEANDLALRLIAAAHAAKYSTTTSSPFPSTASAPTSAASAPSSASASPPAPPPLHLAVMGGAYHGHLSSLIPLSPYKFWGPGGAGRPPHVHVLPCPDPYRGTHLDGAAAARAALAAAAAAGGVLGGFLCESVLSCGGQVVLPAGYLKALYGVFRAAGVLLVADEVQCGFGRCGAAGFWGFQTQGVLPDIVTMGKPMGNGYPLAGLATTRALAAVFAAPGMEFFSTYGGSTAAVAAGGAVLRVLLRERLQMRAEEVGSYLLRGLRALQSAHGEVLGDVRGLGLLLGLEVVRDGASKRHAPVTARWLKERLKARRLLLSTDGPYDNVVKIKPPLVWGVREADRLLRELSEVLSAELTPQVRRQLAAAEEAHWAAEGAHRQRLYAANEAAMAAYGTMKACKL